jgi:peroxiredoxin
VDAARDRFAAAGCSVLVVSQAKPELLARYLARHPWHVPMVADPERAAYRAFGLERTSWLTFFRPRVLWGYFRGILRGYGVKKPYAGEDVLQLGGDFVLDRRGRVVFAYPSANPTDRPTVAALLAAVGREG